MPHQPVLHRLLVERRRVVVGDEERKPLVGKRSQDPGRRIDRTMVDNRDAVEHGEVVTNECLDDVRFVADMRGADEPHATRVSGG